MLFRSNDTATTEIYTTHNTLSLHDALPISAVRPASRRQPSKVAVFIDFLAELLTEADD